MKRNFISYNPANIFANRYSYLNLEYKFLFCFYHDLSSRLSYENLKSRTNLIKLPLKEHSSQKKRKLKYILLFDYNSNFIRV